MEISPALKSIVDFQLEIAKHSRELTNSMLNIESNKVPRVIQPLEPMPTFNREQFAEYLRTNGLRQATIVPYCAYVNRYIKSNQSPEQFANTYTNINSYNNAVKSIRHYYRFLNRPILNMRIKPNSPERLIVAPTKQAILDILSKVESKAVRAYLALCATCGLRSRRLLALKWSELNFETGIINISENVRTKHYRPNVLHIDVATMLMELPRTTEYVFNFTSSKVGLALKRIGTKLRPNNLRDYFYNESINAGINPNLVEWLMGHNIGIRAHYQADSVKVEYAKFESQFRIPLENHV